MTASNALEDVQHLRSLKKPNPECKKPVLEWIKLHTTVLRFNYNYTLAWPYFLNTMHDMSIPLVRLTSVPPPPS